MATAISYVNGTGTALPIILYASLTLEYTNLKSSGKWLVLATNLSRAVFSIYKASIRQAEYIRQHAELNPVPMPPMPIRYRFEKIHGDRSGARFLKYFAGIESRLDSCRNSLAAQYYGEKYLLSQP